MCEITLAVEENRDLLMTVALSTGSSTTNLERVVILESNWDVGNIGPKSSRNLTATVYVPENLKGDTLRIPMTIKYFNSYFNY